MTDNNNESTQETVTKQLNISEVTENQKKRIFLLCERVNLGEITKNEAYRYSQLDGETEVEKGYKGSYKDWITLAQSNEWLNIANAEQVAVVEPPKKKTNYIAPILIGVGVALILRMIIKSGNKTESK